MVCVSYLKKSLALQLWISLGRALVRVVRAPVLFVAGDRMWVGGCWDCFATGWFIQEGWVLSSYGHTFS